MRVFQSSKIGMHFELRHSLSDFISQSLGGYSTMMHCDLMEHLLLEFCLQHQYCLL